MLAWIFLIIQFSLALLFFFLCLAFATGAPFVPSASGAVSSMMRFADIRPGQHVIDLGSGDGRLLLLAAKKGATATGFEINPFIVLWANIRAVCSPYRNSVHTVWKNFWTADISRADVVFVYLLPWKMETLERKLLTQLKPGSIVVSNSFIFPHIPQIHHDAKEHVYAFAIPKKEKKTTPIRL